jgi:hypothetical protein
LNPVYEEVENNFNFNKPLKKSFIETPKNEQMDSILLKLREEMNQQNRDLNNYIEKLKQEAQYASDERNKA